MLVVIGPQWLSATDAQGRRRITDPSDFIRSEIAAALAEGKPVVPVLVGGAHMPSLDGLPDDLRELARYNALTLSDESWSEDVARLSAALDPLMGRTSSSQRTVAAEPAPPAQPARTAAPFLARLAQAFGVLRGHSSHDDIQAARASPAFGTVPDGSMHPAGAASSPRRNHQIFVSYSTKDSAVADRVVASLEARGKMCWIAPRDIAPGVPSWAEPIVTAIASSKLVLVLLTQHSIPSVDVMREVSLAADEKIPLLGVNLDAAPLSPGLRYYFVAGQRLDLARLGQEEQVRNIVPAVERQLPAST
jgi:hypothetical protein